MFVREAMTRRVECVAPEDTLQEAAQRMKALDVGVLPVCDQNRVVGMLTDRDITVRAVAEGYDPHRAKVREAMTPGVNTCFEDESVVEAARLMREKQVRRLAVLDRGNRLIGILSLGDLAVGTGGEEWVAGKTLEKTSRPADAK